MTCNKLKILIKFKLKIFKDSVLKDSDQLFVLPGPGSSATTTTAAATATGSATECSSGTTQFSSCWSRWTWTGEASPTLVMSVSARQVKVMYAPEL